MVPKLEGALSHETLLCGKETATVIVATHCAQPMAACDPQPTTTQCTNLRFRGGDAGSWQQHPPRRDAAQAATRSGEAASALARPALRLLRTSALARRRGTSRKRGLTTGTGFIKNQNT